MKLDKVKILADKLYNQKVIDGWKNVSMIDCLKRTTDYYRIDEIVKNNDSLHSVVGSYDHCNIVDLATNKTILTIPANRFEVKFMDVDKEVGKIII